MRFNPKIVRSGETPLEGAGACWSDDEFEARLPGDLEMLAAQLRDDAVQLSSRYPASEPAFIERAFIEPAAKESALESSPRRTSRRWFVAGSLASVLLLVSAALPWLMPGDSSSAGRSADGDSPTLVLERDLRARTQADVGLHRMAQNPIARNPVAQGSDEASGSHEPHLPAGGTVPALFLQNVSGPELEGLFDLWEADEVEQSRISI